MTYVPDALKDIAVRVHAGETVTMTVRELLSLFNAMRRGSNVVWMVRAALRAERLITYPDFEQTYIDVRTELRPVALEEPAPSPTSGAETGLSEEPKPSPESL